MLDSNLSLDASTRTPRIACIRSRTSGEIIVICLIERFETAHSGGELTHFYGGSRANEYQISVMLIQGYGVPLLGFRQFILDQLHLLLSELHYSGDVLVWRKREKFLSFPIYARCHPSQHLAIK
jgi:hypothetical protein